MHSKLQEAGGTGTLTVACGRFHVCVSAIWTHEARQASDDAAAVIAHSQVCFISSGIPAGTPVPVAQTGRNG